MYAERTYPRAKYILISLPRLLVLEPIHSGSALERLSRAYTLVDRQGVDSNFDDPSIEGIFVKLKYSIDAKLLDRFVNLRFVASPTTGLTHVDTNYLVSRRIDLISLKSDREFISTLTSTAELVWGHILFAYRRLGCAVDSVKGMQWDRDLFVGRQLQGKTIGILGYGRLGSMVAEVARAFRMNVVYYDPYVSDAPIGTIVPLDQLLETSDIISLHVHVDKETRDMLSFREFEKMRLSPLLVNTSRGELINEEALLDALMTKKICGACLDVLTGEHSSDADQMRFWMSENKLVRFAQQHDNLIITPHIGGLVEESITRAEERIVDQIIDKIDRTQ